MRACLNTLITTGMAVYRPSLYLMLISTVRARGHAAYRLPQGFQVCHQMGSFYGIERLRRHGRTGLDELRIYNPAPLILRRIIKTARQHRPPRPIADAVEGRAGVAAFTPNLMASDAPFALEELLTQPRIALAQHARRHGGQRPGSARNYDCGRPRGRCLLRRCRFTGCALLGSRCRRRARRRGRSRWKHWRWLRSIPWKAAHEKSRCKQGPR